MPRIEALTGVTELRQCIRDLIAITSLPSIQTECKSLHIADHVAEALRPILDLELVQISMRDKADAPPQTSISRRHGARAASGPDSSKSHLNEMKSCAKDQVRPDDAELRYTTVPIGLGGLDFFVAGSREPEFPTEHERLFMSIAADAVAVALQGWRAEIDNNRFLRLAENAADFVGYADLEGRLHYLNPAGCEMVGLSDMKEACEYPILQYVIPVERRRMIEEIAPSVVSNGRWRGELQFRHFKTGVAIPVSVDCFRTDDQRDERLTHIGVVGCDLRPMKSAENNLRELNQSLETRILERTTALADANCKLLKEIAERERTDTLLQKVQSELFNSVRVSAAGQMGTAMAHELNQPLAASANYINSARRLLSEESFLTARDAASAALDEAFEEIERTQKIIRQMREFITRGTTARQWVNLKEVVTNASALALTGQNCAHVKVEFAFASEFTMVHVNRIQIQQVLTNLVRNALEAMAETNGGELTITTAMHPKDTVVVTVSDTGPGIAPEIADILFEPFTSTKREGMGIGLSISKSIVESHGGDLICEPRSGSGVAFRFSLHAAPGAKADAD